MLPFVNSNLNPFSLSHEDLTAINQEIPMGEEQSQSPKHCEYYQKGALEKNKARSKATGFHLEDKAIS